MPKYFDQKDFLKKRFKPSEPCSCKVCLSYCERPGWWTVPECRHAYNFGLLNRMMLEISPERTFGVLSPAFQGCEGKISTNQYSENKCTFFKMNLCELFGTGFQPLECRFCHHARKGEGILCHNDIEENWKSEAGRMLVRQWCRKVGIWEFLDSFGLSKLKIMS